MECRLRRRQITRIEDLETNTATGLKVDGSGGVNNKFLATQTGAYVLDVEELQRRVTQEAIATFEEAPLLEQGCTVRSEREPAALKTFLKKGLEVAFWPISKPVKGILYVQRHWEELFWDSIGAAVRKCKGTNTQNPADTARTSMPGSSTSQPHLLSHSPILGPSIPPPLPNSSRPPNKKAMGASQALEESRRSYSHLPLAHALNVQPRGSRDEESGLSLRADGTISRLDIPRSDLERLPTQDWKLTGY